MGLPVISRPMASESPVTTLKTPAGILALSARTARARAEQGVAIIEWADRVLPLLPESYLQVGLTIISARKRQITLTGIGAQYGRLLDRAVPE